MKILKDTYGFAVQDADGHITICGECEKIYVRQAIPTDNLVLLRDFEVNVNKEEVEVYKCPECGEEFMGILFMEYCTECGTPVEEEKSEN